MFVNASDSPPDDIAWRINTGGAAVGEVIELKSGKRWEDFVRERILTPLEMPATSYTIPDMTSHPDHGVPYREKRDSFDLYQIPYYEDTEGVAPAGAAKEALKAKRTPFLQYARGQCKCPGRDLCR